MNCADGMPTAPGSASWIPNDRLYATAYLENTWTEANESNRNYAELLTQCRTRWDEASTQLEKKLLLRSCSVSVSDYFKQDTISNEIAGSSLDTPLGTQEIFRQFESETSTADSPVAAPPSPSPSTPQPPPPPPPQAQQQPPLVTSGLMSRSGRTWKEESDRRKEESGRRNRSLATPGGPSPERKVRTAAVTKDSPPERKSQPAVSKVSPAKGSPAKVSPAKKQQTEKLESPAKKPRMAASGGWQRRFTVNPSFQEPPSRGTRSSSQQQSGR